MTVETHAAPAPAAPPAPGERWLCAAAQIGRSLCGAAVWDEAGERCNWLGRMDEAPPPAAPAPAVAALGPHLYGGSAGVALFLAELAGRTGEPDFARTAAGALRRSAGHYARTPAPASPLSFFSAHLGTAYAAVRCLALDPACGLEGEVARLLAAVEAGAAAPHALDLIGGSAGAVPALLALSRRPGLERCAGLALACARETCAAALWRGGECAWPSAPGAGAPPLTGLSHGASGYALALLEAYAEWGDPAFVRAARGAFAFEDRAFDAARGNWLDLRFPLPGPDGVPEGTVQAAWCHGAPGIGLARLRAREADPARADAHDRAARTALATTLAALRRTLEAPGADATLCHGAAGLGEVALLLAEGLDDPRAREEVDAAAGLLVSRHGERGDWPTAAPAGAPKPALMIGVAGIGHHLLRLHDPAKVPPVLLLRREAGAPPPEAARVDS